MNKEDSDAFIFTLKNPHGVGPMKLKQKENHKYYIICDPNYGPIFRGNDGRDICIGDNCKREKSCSIDNDGKYGYKCHTKLKKSLFVDTNDPDKTNYFAVSDYEVFTHD